MTLRFFAVAASLVISIPAFAQVVINEIHYNPDVKTEPVEFIELHNRGISAMSLAGWQFCDGVNFTFPGGTTIPAGGFVVVAENPVALQAKFGVNALGPWTGSLDNDGETIVLRNAAGDTEDKVDYQLGFPWPTVGDPPGYSIELANPAFDNDLGGNWRRSLNGNPEQQNATLIPDHSTWQYFKGFSEASSPSTAWRELNFDDSGWFSGSASIGYGEEFISTVLSDMQGNYGTVFFRQTFAVTNPAVITSLMLEAQYDDGFKVWINGVSVLDVNISTGEVPYSGSAEDAIENFDYQSFNLNSPQSYLVPGTNVIAIQGANASIGGSSDFFLDVRLQGLMSSSASGPTPGTLNSVFATNVPPQIRQVNHEPKEPRNAQPVTITAKVTDPEGVASVSLLYQLVDPGNYIELTDAAYMNNWTTAPMNDNGTGGDALAGDSIFTAVLPGTLQEHRRLVRYRVEATDTVEAAVTVPYPDDPQPNFAYFCYDGVPAWHGAVRQGQPPVITYDTNVMRRLPVVHLIAKNSAVEDATWFSRYGGDLYLWQGTLIYDGRVYDHVRYRARGGVWRYAMVKNMWKFDFNRGHDFQMRDNYGRKYDTKWTKLNFGANIQQADSGHRGEQGMFESMGFRLFDLAGVEAPHTTFLQFRIIDDTMESTPDDQHEGDFWGLYLAIEQENGRFLDEHGLPDGNFYKMEGGTGELNNLAPTGPTDKSDLNYILGNYTDATEAWWRTNWVLPNYYSYQTIVQAVHHYDINAGKNYFYYRNPETALWKVIPWDLDLTWAHNMYNSSWGGLNTLASRILEANAEPGTGSQSGTYNLRLTGARPEFEMEFRNRVREIRDLLWNTDQAYQLIDEYSRLVRGPTNGPTLLEADRSMWDFNPKMSSSDYSSTVSKAGRGRFYQWPLNSTVSKDFNGCIQLMKDYVVIRAEHLDSLAADAAIPTKPSAVYSGPAGYPLNRLTFQSSAYAGANGFAAMKWRVAKVTDPMTAGYDPTDPVDYEIAARWESEEITPFNSEVTLPTSALKVGSSYRVRVQMKDSTGRWSHWSDPVQFVVAPPDNAADLVSHLRLTELMYHPTAGGDFEFIELRNSSDTLTLNLDGTKFTSGVDFTLAADITIPPGGYLIVIKHPDPAAFRAHYGLSPSVPMVGPYSGSLANKGEQITLKTGAGGLKIVAFEFNDRRGWPLGASGAGHSLVPMNPAADGQASGALDYPGNWRASAFIGGSPGATDSEPPAVTILINEFAAHTDFFDPARPEYDSDDWIELYNTTGADMTPTHWFLSDDPDTLKKWALPMMPISGKTWISFSEVNDFHNPITNGFGLDKAGEQLLLSFLPGNAEDRVVDAIKFKGQENDVSLGRYPDGGVFWHTMLRTRDTANTTPLISAIITEVYYHPPDLGTNDNTRDEYVELYNPTALPLALESTNGAWRMDGGIGFTFPPGTTLPASGSLLVVNIDPADTTTLAAFRQANGITNTSLPILGPYSGKLGNRSDRVALERPQYPDLPGAPYSWVIVDEVIYGNQSPWPSNAQGSGNSLHRLSLTQSGLNPANWAAAPPSAGYIDTSSDWDKDGVPNDWEINHDLDPDNPDDADLDSDGDRMSNREEFIAGTDPQEPSSFLGFDSVTVEVGEVALEFTAMAGRTYTIQYCEGLETELWEKLTDVTASSTNRTVMLSDSDLSAADRFYQLVTPSLP